MTFEWLRRKIVLFSEFLRKPDISNRGRLYVEAVGRLGRDASPRNLVDSELACAESVSQIIHDVWPEFQPVVTGTYTLWESLDRSSLFKRTIFPRAGTVIISPTGKGNGKIRGHTGIIGDDDTIFSNDSQTGLWLENYTLEGWKRKYADVGGFPIYYYDRV